MLRLDSYAAAVVASVLVMVVTPGNFIGLPIGIWAFVTLSNREVRAAFATQSARRSASSAHAASLSGQQLTPPRPRLVYFFATHNVVVALVLMFILAAPESEPFVPEPDNPWRIYEQLTAALGFIMCAGLFAAGVGLYLWRPWARKLTIGVMIYGLASLVIDIPFMARRVIPELFAEIQIDLLAEGMPPASAEVSAMSVLALIFVPVLVIGLALNIGQMVYLMRPRVVAAFQTLPGVPSAADSASPGMPASPSSAEDPQARSDWGDHVMIGGLVVALMAVVWTAMQFLIPWLFAWLWPDAAQ
jgi:hypothetical protein